MALDGLFNMGETGSSADFIALFDTLGQANVLIVPAIECNAPAQYTNAVVPLLGRYAPGLVIKSTVRQLQGIQNWIAQQNWAPADIDLIVNAGRVGAYDPDQFGGYLISALNAALPRVPWRSVTLAAAAAPKDLSTFGTGRATVPRLDWQLWQQVSAQMPFQLDYGDYGTADPDLTEPPGVAAIRATVSVRYSIDAEWIVRKGYPTRGARARPMDQQYRAHAAALTAEPSFAGVAGCWADRRIQEIAAGLSSSGNRTTWVEIGVNRHLSLVADRLP